MRRHWQLVICAFCAFSLCWWAYGRLPTEELAETENDPTSAEAAGRGKRRPGASWPQTLKAVRGWLVPYVMLNHTGGRSQRSPLPPRLRALLERAFSGRGL